MRIFHLIHQYPPDRYGGAERHVQQLARAQAVHNDMLVYTQATNHQGDGAADDVGEGMRVRRWLDRTPGAQRRLSEDLDHTIRDFRPDVVHIHHGIGFAPDTLLQIAQRVPTMATLHDDWWICPRVRPMYRGESPCEGPTAQRCNSCFHDRDGDMLVGEAASLAEFGPWRSVIRRRRDTLSVDQTTIQSARERIASLLESRRLTRSIFFLRRKSIHGKILKFCRAIICPSQHLLGRYREAGLDLSAVARVVPYGVEPRQPQNRSVIKHSIRFAVVGSLDNDKGTLLAIRAFETISPQDATLTLIGPWGIPESPDVVLRSCPAVRYVGFVAPDERDIWDDIDVLIVPSLWNENAPMVITESHAAGVPVIVADHGALPETIPRGQGGWTFTGLDAFSLRSVVIRLIREPAEIDRVAATIRPPVPIATVAELIGDVYRRISSTAR